VSMAIQLGWPYDIDVSPQLKIHLRRRFGLVCYDSGEAPEPHVNMQSRASGCRGRMAVVRGRVHRRSPNAPKSL
jgi:hypothetical protein